MKRASWCIILGFGGFAWTSAPEMGKGGGVGVVFLAVSMLSRQQIPCGFDFTRGPGTAKEQITSLFMRKGCLRSSLLPAAQTHTEFCCKCKTVILIDQWFFTGARKLVKNLCFRMMRFPGSRWSIFISKSTKRTKSSFSPSFIGKTWKKNSSKTVSQKKTKKNCRHFANICLCFM